MWVTLLDLSLLWTLVSNEVIERVAKSKFEVRKNLEVNFHSNKSHRFMVLRSMLYEE